MATKKQTKAFILKTLLPYKEDRSRCAFDGDKCSYLTSSGEKCALGMWLKKGEWQHEQLTGAALFEKYGKDILLKPARRVCLDMEDWTLIQNYHDERAHYNRLWLLNVIVGRLERSLGIDLPELMYDTKKIRCTRNRL